MRQPKPGQNDLASLYPHLAAQWHPDKNGSLTPDQVTPGSHRMVWWVCDKGHTWQAIVKSRVSGSGCPVCANRQLLTGVNDLETIHPELVRQWDPEKNAPLTPRDVTSVSYRKVWWRCGKGHSWQAAIRDRVNGGTGCPVCGGRIVAPGETDLAARFPEIAAQWHPTKNGRWTPEQVSPSSNRRIWWICDRGHEYQAPVYIRTSGSGCPYCAGKKVLSGFNDLATLAPEVAEQWHPTLNGSLTPDQITAGSHRKAWWICGEGHVWKAALYSRTGPKHQGCPYCAGIRVWPGFNDLTAREPEIARQWHPTLNGSLTPEQVMPGSHRMIWWQCREGHVWKAAIYSRTGTMRRGCPVCARKAKDRYAHVMEQQFEVKKHHSRE